MIFASSGKSNPRALFSGIIFENDRPSVDRVTITRSRDGATFIARRGASFLSHREEGGFEFIASRVAVTRFATADEARAAIELI